MLGILQSDLESANGELTGFGRCRLGLGGSQGFKEVGVGLFGLIGGSSGICDGKVEFASV